MGTRSTQASKDREQLTPPPAPAGGSHPPEAGDCLEDRLDEALDESFPASDPPAVHRLQRGLSFLP